MNRNTPTPTDPVPISDDPTLAALARGMDQTVYEARFDPSLGYRNPAEIATPAMAKGEMTKWVAQERDLIESNSVYVVGARATIMYLRRLIWRLEHGETNG